MCSIQSLKRELDVAAHFVTQRNFLNVVFELNIVDNLYFKIVKINIKIMLLLIN